MFIDKHYFFTTTNIRQRKIIYHNRVWKRLLYLSFSLSPHVFNKKSVTLLGHLFAYIFFSYFIYSAYQSRTMFSHLSIFNYRPATRNKIILQFHTVSYNTCNSETHEKNLFNVKQTNSCNLNYKVIQLIIVLSLLLFQRCIQRSFVASSIVDWEYREIYNGGS